MGLGLAAPNNHSGLLTETSSVVCVRPCGDQAEAIYRLGPLEPSQTGGQCTGSGRFVRERHSQWGSRLSWEWLALGGAVSVGLQGPKMSRPQKIERIGKTTVGPHLCARGGRRGGARPAE